MVTDVTKLMKVFLALFSLTLPLLSVADDGGVTVTVTVTNIPGAKGDLLIGLYDSAKTFTDSPMEISPKVELTSAENQTVSIENVAKGTYAIAVIQDLNKNGKLDKNFLGMPKEPLAFSIIKKIPKGKPKFTACSFEVKDEPVELTIPLVLK